MMTITFTRKKPLIVNGKRYKPFQSYEMTDEEWGAIYDTSCFQIEPTKEEIIEDNKLIKELKTKKKNDELENNS